jgi:hypothetical protein
MLPTDDDEQFGFPDEELERQESCFHSPSKTRDTGVGLVVCVCGTLWGSRSSWKLSRRMGANFRRAERLIAALGALEDDDEALPTPAEGD